MTRSGIVVHWVMVMTLLLASRPALAHPAPFSYLDLDMRADRIDGALVIHVFDAAHDLGVNPPERLLDQAFLDTQRSALQALLLKRLNISTDVPLTPDWEGVQPLAEQQAVRLDFHLPARRPATLTVQPRMFPYDPAHQSFVNIYEQGELKQQYVFAASSAAKVYYAGTRQGVLAVVGTFIQSGIHHILIGPDHILFLIGLLLLGGSWGALIRIVTAFTIGHSITLSLAALDIVSPPARIIEPAIALSIVFVGSDNLVRGTGRDVRAWIALVFGLVHGFGFANVLRELGLPREALGWSLFSFNTGVEIGQLAIVVLVSTLLAGIRRRSDVIGYRVAFAGSIVVIAAGTYWFVQRVFFPA